LQRFFLLTFLLAQSFHFHSSPPPPPPFPLTMLYRTPSPHMAATNPGLRKARSQRPVSVIFRLLPPHVSSSPSDLISSTERPCPRGTCHCPSLNEFVDSPISFPSGFLFPSQSGELSKNICATHPFPPRFPTDDSATLLFFLCHSVTSLGFSPRSRSSPAVNPKRRADAAPFEFFQRPFFPDFQTRFFDYAVPPLQWRVASYHASVLRGEDESYRWNPFFLQIPTKYFLPASKNATEKVGTSCSPPLCFRKCCFFMTLRLIRT